MFHVSKFFLVVNIEREKNWQGKSDCEMKMNGNEHKHTHTHDLTTAIHQAFVEAATYLSQSEERILKERERDGIKG